LLFNFYVTLDSKKPTINIAGFAQGGLTLPYEGLYLEDDDDTVKIRKKFIDHMRNMFQLVGESQGTAINYANQVLEFETSIAKFTVPSDQLTDPFETYNKLDIDGLKRIAPGLAWDSFRAGLGSQFTQATVDVPSFYGNLSSLVSNTDISVLKVYLKFQVLTRYATRLSKPFRDEVFDFFGKTLRGVAEQPARNKTCIGYVDSHLGELLGKYFLDRAFPGASRERALSILIGIENAMENLLNQLDWMDEVTRERALDKLRKVHNMIGGPTNPRNYSEVDISPTAFFFNLIESERADAVLRVKMLEAPVDKTQWDMTPATVNAYYDPTRNQMVFPAGIQQQPFFNLTYPSSMNIGGIGMVMGHELTHGFDNQGRDFDGDGVLENWWEEETSRKFDEKVKCVIDQYSTYEIIKGVFINGKLTQGENIADMGGMKNAARHYKSVIGDDANKESIVSGLTNLQLFFVGFGQTWCEKATDQYYRVQVQTDPHSPAKFRVLGPLRNLPDFADTFHCPEGTFMNPTDRCQVW
jgi:predicted metalloendopeptidase